MGKLGEGGGLGTSWNGPKRRRRKKVEGLPEKQVDKVLSGNKVIAAIEAKAEAVKAYWQSIAPVFDENDMAKEHRQTPARGKPGAYRDSIKVFMTADENGPYARVKPTDWKSKMIEFGNEPHMPIYAPMAKTKAKFRK